jgi:hypothetical protein
MCYEPRLEIIEDQIQSKHAGYSTLNQAIGESSQLDDVLVQEFRIGLIVFIENPQHPTEPECRQNAKQCFEPEPGVALTGRLAQPA